MRKGMTSHYVCDRRNFLKTLGVVSCVFATDSLRNIPVLMAKNIYPTEKISWVLPFIAGGGYDIVCRGITPYLTKYLRESSPGTKGGDLIIKNEPTASGRKGVSTVYNAKPDGYTIGAFDLAFATETLMSKLEFDLAKFTYLLRIMRTTRILVTGKTGFASWEEMLKHAKAKELKWGVAGFGRGIHVESIIFKETVGIPIRFIPWGGTAECMNAMIRGDIQVALVSEDAVKGLLDAGEIKVLTVFSETSGYPGIPSIKDLGYPELAEKTGNQRFVIAPPALPEEIKSILIGAFKKTLNDKEFQAWAKKSGFPLSPIYGDEADRLAKRMLKFYQEDLRPTLKKYLS